MQTTNKFAVFGNPITHSLSPQIHTHFAQQFDLDITYSKIHAEEFHVSAAEFIQNGGAGFNITVPFKEDAYTFADTLDESAQFAGAVNTIHVTNGKTIAYNTDGIGLVNDITKNIGIDITGKTLLILGAGGASRGIIPALLQHNPAKLMIANRTASKAQDLAQEFAYLGPTCGFGLDKVKGESVDIVINATSSSIDGVAPDINPACMNGATCYDLMYGKRTAFMQLAQENNAKSVYDGWGMLVEQAAKAFEIWFNKTPDTSDLIRHPLKK